MQLHATSIYPLNLNLTRPFQWNHQLTPAFNPSAERTLGETVSAYAQWHLRRFASGGGRLQRDESMMLSDNDSSDEEAAMMKAGFLAGPSGAMLGRAESMCPAEGMGYWMTHAEDSSSSSSVLDSSDYDEVSSDVSDPAYDTYGMQRRSYAAVQARGSGGGHASGGGNRGSGSSVHGSTPRARASTAGNSEYDSHLERARSSTAGKGKDLLNAALGHVQSVVRLSRGGGERASRRKSDGRSGGGGRGSKKAKANARHARPRRHPPLLPEQLPEKSGQIHIAQPHRCDLEQCKRKLGAFTETLQKYHVACTWSGGTAALKGVALKGTIDIEEARVMVKLKLSFVVPREKLRKSILKRLRKADFANP